MIDPHAMDPDVDVEEVSTERSVPKPAAATVVLVVLGAVLLGVAFLMLTSGVAGS